MLIISNKMPEIYSKWTVYTTYLSITNQGDYGEGSPDSLKLTTIHFGNYEFEDQGWKGRFFSKRHPRYQYQVV